MSDFLFRGKLAELDPEVYELDQFETERQYRKLIMIPSESVSPLAVREALGSALQNIYAEGFPDEETRRMTQAEILDYPERLSNYRRYADPRYYKGVEYADAIEALARRRCTELFAANGVSPDNLYANVQPLSGGPANNAVFTAMLNPGDTIMGMNLLHGGHLSHGSSANRSGKIYKAVHYTVSPDTEKIDYAQVEALAKEHRPKILIAGYSSYSWMPDWARFRAIADSVGAILLADISHIAGMVAAGVVPSPVGHAQIITFTTHKTLCGPRGGAILTNDASLSRKIDRAVFPGEQGGPHMHVLAAIALTFKLDRSQQFKQLQAQILRNCTALTARLQARGMRIPFGGSDTHLTNLDCKSVTGPDGTLLSGDMAARILDIVGIVVNRNTIPGDKNAQAASGIRLGTPWVTQRGLREPEMVQIADVIVDVLKNCTPYEVETRQGLALRAKVDFNVLEDARLKIRALAESAAIDGDKPRHGYPHFYYRDDRPASQGACANFDLSGKGIRSFTNYAFTSASENLDAGQIQPTRLVTTEGSVDGALTCLDATHFRLTVPAGQAGLAATFLRDLSDGYIRFDADPTCRLPGPIVIVESPDAPASIPAGNPVDFQKPYAIGLSSEPSNAAPLPRFTWEEKQNPIRKTALNETHRKMGAKMVPFAGWDMPVWYTSVVEEHLATRQAAGLFDVSHMGVYQAEGPDAAVFLDSVCGNDIAGLAVAESCYSHFLDPEANVIDDTLIYRRSAEKYLVVVNASNDDKDWAWLNAVRDGHVQVDLDRPAARAFGRRVDLRNLRDPAAGDDQRVDIALQGPRSREILLALGCDAPTRRRIMALKRTELCEGILGGFDLVVSRTGYTGERMAFELFIHPNQAPALWAALMQAGAPQGLKACGLGARDSLRTEAGLPLYGHEMGGDLGLGVAEAGFGSYVKVYKPWFIGRAAYLAREAKRKGVVVRFHFSEKGIRMAHSGDPVLDRKGKMVGQVTSCAIDSEGFLTGQAFVELKSAEPGTPVIIYQSAAKAAGKAPADLAVGDRVTLPTAAVIVSRFPKLTLSHPQT